MLGNTLGMKGHDHNVINHSLCIVLTEGEVRAGPTGEEPAVALWEGICPHPTLVPRRLSISTAGHMPGLHAYGGPTMSLQPQWALGLRPADKTPPPTAGRGGGPPKAST